MIFTRLVSRQPIGRRRAGRQRQVTVTLLRADGSGEPYTRPTGQAGDRFLKLSHTLWLDRWDERLSLPALAMLLVALHEKPGFTLPREHAPQWYGWSADTAERGLAELERAGVIDVGKRTTTDPLSPTGRSTRNVYTVWPPFDPNTLGAVHVGRGMRGGR